MSRTQPQVIGGSSHTGWMWYFASSHDRHFRRPHSDESSPPWEKQLRTRPGRVPHDWNHRNGRVPDAPRAVSPCMWAGVALFGRRAVRSP
eukprot:gene19988-biopygen20567